MSVLTLSDIPFVSTNVRLGVNNTQHCDVSDDNE
jgi:hypothetical protein